MIIHSPEVVHVGTQVRLQSLIEYDNRQEILWYSFDRQFEPYLTTEKLDGFLVGMLILAMKLGEDIEVRGAVSERLYYNLTSYAMDVLVLVRPALSKVNISVESLDNGSTSVCKGVAATGFSGGVDAFCAIHDHTIEAISDHYRITHLIFNNVGSHGSFNTTRARALFNKRFELVKGFPASAGMSIVKIDSNLSDLLKMQFASIYTPRNITTVLLLQKLFGKYFYASGHPYYDCHLFPDAGFSRADPILLPLLSTETLQFVSTGCQYTRIEKTQRAAQVKGVGQWLSVCGADNPDGKNCSECWKCKRTLFTLEMLGLLDQFGSVFDLDRWRKIKNMYIVTIVLGTDKDCLVQELRDYAKEIDYPFTLWQRSVSRVINAIQYILPFRPMHVARAVRRKFTTPADSVDTVS